MKKLQAQQITEFMLAAPLLIAFFVILTEFAFAFNAHLVFSNAIKSSISAYLSASAADSTDYDYENAVKTYILADMKKNKITNLNSLDIKLITVDDYPVVIGSYTYKPGFSFAFLPALKNIQMNSASVFPIQKPQIGTYKNGFSTNELNKIQPQTTPDQGELQ